MKAMVHFLDNTQQVILCFKKKKKVHANVSQAKGDLFAICQAPGSLGATRAT